MSGITDLQTLLSSLSPGIVEGRFVFCTLAGDLADYVGLNPLMVFREAEGLTLVLNEDVANQAGLSFEGIFSQITLAVHSGLDAVGLTAAVSSQLTSRGISANIIAAYYHDHVFVPTKQADRALAALKELTA